MVNKIDKTGGKGGDLREEHLSQSKSGNAWWRWGGDKERSGGVFRERAESKERIIKLDTVASLKKEQLKTKVQKKLRKVLRLS